MDAPSNAPSITVSNAQPVLQAMHATNATNATDERDQDLGRKPRVLDAGNPVDKVESVPAETVKLGDALDGLLSDRERLPVLNREPHAAIGKGLRLGLWMRDGGLCWIGGHTAVNPVADHVRPRSNWPAELLRFADRSDNLRLACWTCNETKSNYDYPGGDMPLGITFRCARCNEDYQNVSVGGQVRCFCIHCGMGGVVPSEEYYLSAEPACELHPGRPARTCDRCAELAVAS